MRSSSIFWGIFLIFMGIFVFLGQFGFWSHDLGYLFNLWPLVLVLWGVSLLKIPYIVKQILSGVSGFLLALFIIASLHHSWFNSFEFCSDDEQKGTTYFNNKNNFLSEEYKSNYQYASLAIDGGACSFNFSKTDKKLIEAYSSMPLRYFNIESNEDSNSINLNLQMKLGKVFWKKHQDNQVSVKLNPNPIWDFDFNIGAVEFDCNLSNFKVRNITIDAGAADIELTLGSLWNETNVTVETGASNVEITIPQSAGCKILANTGLSGKDFSGFQEIDGNYFTPGYDKSLQKIIINISGGISNFTVHRN
jgi:hypothetical protein